MKKFHIIIKKDFCGCRKWEVYVGFIIAIISGVLMSVQGVFNTGVTKTTGIWVSNCFVQLTALLTGVAIWFMFDRQSFMNLTKVSPKYMLLGGIMGTAITYTVIKSMESLGPAVAVMTIVIAQITVAYVIELFGMFGVEKAAFDLRKLIGVFLSITGIVLMKIKK